MAFRDVVVLIPGFLGFSRLGGFFYFAERCAAALRGALESLKDREIPVVAVSALPTDRLVNRQAWLIRALAELCDTMGGVSRLHLVGHSTGGVDAQLLTCERPLGRDEWTAKDRWLRDKITTVVGISAPHHGTCLSNAPLAKLLADPVKQLTSHPVAHVAMLPSLLRQIRNLSRLAVSESDMILLSVLARLQDAIRFVSDVLRHRGLVDDLAPAAMAATRRDRGKSNTRLRSFVTVAPLAEHADKFFRDLYHLTSDTTGMPSSDALRAAASLLTRCAGAAICSSTVPVFDEHANDGVVNSVSQLVDPGDPDELAGIVVADHADVIGHYDRADMFMHGAPLNLGLFHSGAGFGDDQFYALYGRVAEVLAPQMR